MFSLSPVILLSHIYFSAKPVPKAHNLPALRSPTPISTPSRLSVFPSQYCPGSMTPQTTQYCQALPLASHSTATHLPLYQTRPQSPQPCTSPMLHANSNSLAISPPRIKPPTDHSILPCLSARQSFHCHASSSLQNTAPNCTAFKLSHAQRL